MDLTAKVSLRHKVAQHLDIDLLGRIGLINKVIIAVILLSILVSILETESSIRVAFNSLFVVSEVVFLTVFGIEYAL